MALVMLSLWMASGRAPVESPAPVERPVAAPSEDAPAPPKPAESAPAIEHRLELPSDAASGPPSKRALDFQSELIRLFGRKSVLSMFQLDDFARRVAATVDNLGRQHAPPRLWPLVPAEGRFLTEHQGDSEIISADNGLRYTPHVLLIETVDLHQVVAAYLQLYPLFQQAYEELGYPGRYFNDRVVAVLDQLLATPDIEGPIRMQLPTIRGPLQPQRPWVLYEFADPALQSLSAGQKLLLRTGPVNARRLKARLAELRRLLATGAPRQ